VKIVEWQFVPFTRRRDIGFAGTFANTVNAAPVQPHGLPFCNVSGAALTFQPMRTPDYQAAVRRRNVSDGLRGMIRGVSMILWTLARLFANFLLYLLAH
jgi:hypothetical protein